MFYKLLSRCLETMEISDLGPEGDRESQFKVEID